MHEGNVADGATLLPQVQRLRGRFGIVQMVMVGNRGLMGQATLAQVKSGRSNSRGFARKHGGSGRRPRARHAQCAPPPPPTAIPFGLANQITPTSRKNTSDER